LVRGRFLIEQSSNFTSMGLDSLQFVGRQLEKLLDDNYLDCSERENSKC
jgi:hypothetical protein